MALPEIGRRVLVRADLQLPPTARVLEFAPGDGVPVRFLSRPDWREVTWSEWLLVRLRSGEIEWKPLEAQPAAPNPQGG